MSATARVAYRQISHETRETKNIYSFGGTSEVPEHSANKKSLEKADTFYLLSLHVTFPASFVSNFDNFILPSLPSCGSETRMTGFYSLLVIIWNVESEFCETFFPFNFRSLFCFCEANCANRRR